MASINPRLQFWLVLFALTVVSRYLARQFVAGETAVLAVVAVVVLGATYPVYLLTHRGRDSLADPRDPD